jgi:hypothetical protein
MPSRNSTASGVASLQGSRRRPARYPPSPKAASEVNNNQKPPTAASAAEVSRQLDEGEATANPMPDPNEMRTKETPAATTAPATTGLQCRNVGPGRTGPVGKPAGC